MLLPVAEARRAAMVALEMQVTIARDSRKGVLAD